MITTFKQGYNYGKGKEKELFNKINLYFNDNIIRQKEKYAKYDYKGESVYYELKSRLVNKDRYEDTIIRINKTPTEDEKAIFIFNYTDGTYYIEYDKEKFQNYKVELFQRKQLSDHYDAPKLHYFIPVKDLTEII
jgi:hypothetical protein